MNRYDDNESINIGVGKDISIRELAELVRDIIGFTGDIRYDPTMPDGTPRKVLDVNRLATLGWGSKISLSEGIARTYQWYVSERCKVQGAGLKAVS
jgi:GDP-L-fucose synthase